MALHTQPVQSRTQPTTNYENVLADELEAIYGRGDHRLTAVVDALNETGVRPPGGEDWSTDSFTAELARLGAKETGR